VNPPEIGTVDAKGLFTAAKKGKGQVTLDVTDAKTQKKLSDSTTVDVIQSDAPPDGPGAPPTGLSGLMIPLLAIVALAAVAGVALLLMRKKRKEAVKQAAAGKLELPAELSKTTPEGATKTPDNADKK
jgi:Na+/H+-dicarboxylate symporter